MLPGDLHRFAHRRGALRLHEAPDPGPDPLAGLAEEDHLLDVPADERLEGLEVPVLVAAAQQQDDGRLEGLQGPHHGAYVRPLRVVVEGHAAFLAGQLDAVGKPREACHGLDDRAGRAAGVSGRHDGGHDVFHVVPPGDPDHGCRIGFDLPAPGPVLQFISLEAHALVRIGRRAEKGHPRLEPPGQCGRLRLVGVEHGEIARLLVCEDPLLGVAVLCVIGMVVQVIGCHVEKDRHLRPEGLDALKLEAAHLDDGPLVILGPADITDQRASDVAADEGTLARLREDVADEGRHRRLSVRPRDGDDRDPEKTEGQFDLADHRDAPFFRFTQQRVEGRHPGRGDDQIHAVDDRRVGTPRQDAKRKTRQGPEGLLQLRLRLLVGDGHDGAP